MPREFQVTFGAADPIRAVPLLGRGVALRGSTAATPDRRPRRGRVRGLGGTGPRILFQKVPEPKTAKNRVHLDVRVAPGLEGEERMAALEDECERLVALGATRLQRHEPAPPASGGFIVMADPDGNEFCLD